jgi:ferredoxin-NADP reductase
VSDKPKDYEVAVRNIKDFGNETKHFELFFSPGEGMDFKPGQFVVILLPHDGKIIRRAYSVASPPAIKERLDLVIKLVHGGIVTTWFFGLKEGDQFKIQGPLGKFVLPDPIDTDLGFVATGTGIAPFRSMIPTLLHGGFRKKITLVFGARYEDMVPYHEEWLALAKKYPHFQYVPTISRPKQWSGETGYVQTKVEKYLAESKNTQVYICGLNEMIQSVQNELFRIGYSKEHVHFERYD